MGMNKYKPHIFVLPEDDATRQIANGFVLNLTINARTIQILPPAGGWGKVLDEFEREYVCEMRKYPQRNIVLIIDFDCQVNERLNDIKTKIPQELSNRVFVLGVLSEPEKLRRNLGKNFEDIGKSLSQDCSDNTQKTWGHELLKHNKTELDRMVSFVKPFLFN